MFWESGRGCLTFRMPKATGTGVPAPEAATQTRCCICWSWEAGAEKQPKPTLLGRFGNGLCGHHTWCRLRAVPGPGLLVWGWKRRGNWGAASRKGISTVCLCHFLQNWLMLKRWRGLGQHSYLSTQSWLHFKIKTGGRFLSAFLSSSQGCTRAHCLGAVWSSLLRGFLNPRALWRRHSRCGWDRRHRCTFLPRCFNKQ